MNVENEKKPGKDRTKSGQRMVPHPVSTAGSAATLAAQVRSSDHLRQVQKTDLQPGDWIFVRTIQSTYRIKFKGDGRYEVSGGWFDRKGVSPTELGIAGCTWGGSAIKVDIVAACGLRLEFANRLITSPIQKIILFRQQNVQ